MFEIVSVMVMLFLGRGVFSGKLRFFREGFKFFGRMEMLSEVIFFPKLKVSHGIKIFPVT